MSKHTQERPSWRKMDTRMGGKGSREQTQASGTDVCSHLASTNVTVA